MKKKLENLTVHQFRGLRNLELGDLGRVNILVGPNNSGKTSVLEAISVYCRPLSLFSWIQAARGREAITIGPPLRTRTLVSDLKWLFPQHRTTVSQESYHGHVGIVGTGRRGVLEVKASLQEFVGSWDDEETRGESSSEDTEEIEVQQGEVLSRGVDLTVRVLPGQFDLFTGEIEPSVRYRVWERRPVIGRSEHPGPKIAAAFVSPFSQRDERGSVKLLSQAEIQGFKGMVIDLVTAVDPAIMDLEILSPEGDRPQFHIRHAQLGLAPLSAFGDGVRRMLVIALVLPSVSGGVLLIDEIEASIHVSALRTLFGWIVDSCKKYDVQVFATTHSLEAIDAIVQTSGEHLEDVVGYSLYADHNQTGVKRYSGDMLRRIRLERGLDIRGA